MLESPPPRYDPSRWRVLGMSSLTFAVGFLIIGIVLLTTCQTVTIVGTSSSTVVCHYAFRSYGIASIYVATIVTFLSAYLLALSLKPERPDREWVQQWIVAFAFVAILLTVAFGVLVFWPGST